MRDLTMAVPPNGFAHQLQSAPTATDQAHS